MTDARLQRLFDQGLAPYEQRRQQARAKTPTVAPPKVLTVWQPWAWAIVCGTKRVENRGRPTAYRGRLLIHAGLGPKSGWLDYVTEAISTFPRDCPRPTIDDLREMVGKVIGEVTIVDAQPNGTEPRDPWAVPGQWGWKLERPRPYARPFEIVGQVGLFRLPPQHRADLQRAGIKYWYCDALDVATDDPHQACIAYQNAGVHRLETTVMVNRRAMHFGELLAEAARWHGEERMAMRFERALAERLAGTCSFTGPTAGEPGPRAANSCFGGLSR